MNIEKVFEAVENDDMNSPIVSLCNEFAKQGYRVKIEGVEVNSNEVDTELFNDLELYSIDINFELLKAEESAQKFKLVYIDYHKFNFQPC